MIITVTDSLDGVTSEAEGVSITVIEGSATTGGGGGVTDHGALTGLADDDHTQYHTDARGDARYDALGDADAAQTAAEATAAAALTTHSADTTSVHGIADTTALVLTDDARLTNSRTPTAHATSHQDGGADELALDGSQITAGTVADARIASTIARDSEVTSAISTHEGLSDPHPGYLTTAEGNAAYEASGAVATHAAAADPHTGYLKESDYDANTILAATSDNTPVALTVAASRIVGRKASGDIVAMTAAEAKAVLATVAADIPFTPTGTIAATDVQAAIAEVASEAGGSTPGAWTSFAPVITATTTSPTMGSGAVAVGYYEQIGKTVRWSVRISFGTSGTNAGSGSYRFNLPVAARSEWTTNQFKVGAGTYYDASADGTSALIARMVPSDSSKFSCDIDGATGGGVASNKPAAMAASDTFWLSGEYEAA